MSRDSPHAHGQTSEDRPAFTTGTFHKEPESIIGGGTDTAWLKSNLLALDGGGIRGYWSLLALEKLMEFIAEAEENDVNSNTYHSFYPQSWPRDVSQVPFTEDEKTRIDDAKSDEEKARALPSTRRYLPCHYFDLICGSSTGALIAIMLGRFRMTVSDCIHEYRSLGQEVFGKPRFFIALNFGVGNRYKYSAARLEKVFKDVTKRRNERSDEEVFGKITFPSGKGLCSTFVTTKKTHHKNSVATPYLIRSYDNDKQRTPKTSVGPAPRTTMGSSRAGTDRSADLNLRVGEKGKSRLNYEKAQEFEIWQVARAATAAPLYFEPLKVERARSSGHILFTDGGFSHTNNPTRTGKAEIKVRRGSGSIGIVVSVGTARKKKGESDSAWVRFLNKIPREMRGMAHELSDPEAVHDDMLQEQGFPYYRLNHPDGLDVELDRWEPKQNLFSKDAGSKTITTIRNAFAHWACDTKIMNQFRSCAMALVDCRRKRMNTSKWERYATGARYQCRVEDCDFEDCYEGDDFREHLRSEHTTPEHTMDQEVDHCKHHWRYQAANDTRAH